MVENPPANAEDLDSIPGQEYTLERKMPSHFSILAGKILWTKKLGGLQPMGCK